jgi:hypothetical protein
MFYYIAVTCFLDILPATGYEKFLLLFLAVECEFPGFFSARTLRLRLLAQLNSKPKTSSVPS